MLWVYLRKMSLKRILKRNKMQDNKANTDENNNFLDELFNKIDYARFQNKMFGNRSDYDKATKEDRHNIKND